MAFEWFRLTNYQIQFFFFKSEQIWQGLPQKYIAIKNDTNPADHSQQVV